MHNLTFPLIVFTIFTIFFNYIMGASGINLENSFFLQTAYGLNDDNTYAYKNINHSIEYLPFDIEYPKDWKIEQGAMDEFDYLLLSNPQNNSYFQIFFNSGTANIDDIIYYNNQEIKLHNKIINASEITITNLSNNIHARELIYEYLTSDNQTVTDKYYIISNENGTFVLNPRTISTIYPVDLFDHMLRSFKPFEVQDSIQGNVIDEIKRHASDMTYDGNNDKIYFVYDDKKIGIFDLTLNDLDDMIDTGIEISDIEYSNQAQKLFVTSQIENQLYIYNVTDKNLLIDTVVPISKVKPINLSIFGSMHMALDERNENIYVVSSNSNNITKINYNGTIVKTIPLSIQDNNVRPKDSLKIEVKEYNGENYLFVLDPSSNNLTIINDATNRIVNNIQFDKKFYDMEIDKFNNKLYLTGNKLLNEIDLIKTNDSIELYNQKEFQIPYPLKVVVNPINKNLFIPQPPSNKIIIIDPMNISNNRYKAVINTDTLPVDVVFDEKSNIGYVTHKGSNTITTFNGTDNGLLYFVKFKLAPENSAKIECGNVTYNGNSSSFFKPETECRIIANDGFRLSSIILDNAYNDPYIRHFDTNTNPQDNMVTNFFISISNNL
ncbi:MAG TPA: hypothetical protein VJP58_11460, partial [Candidatus Nitrosocosmicus sp.]|nr:hypothetical protein [Candidatus Nitrosocosmicus sp.]